MPNSLQSSAIVSPASPRATNCSLSSITEHSFQGITPSPLRGESVTYVSGTMCYLCLRSLTLNADFGIAVKKPACPNIDFSISALHGQTVTQWPQETQLDSPIAEPPSHNTRG